MSRNGISGVSSLSRTVFLTSLLLCSIQARAQQSEIPPVETIQSDKVDDAGDNRVVNGRPALYPVKRALHPFTWLEAGVRPVVRTIERFGSTEGSNSGKPTTPKSSGIKISLNNMGARSGFGPQVKPFTDSFLGTGIQFEMPLLMTYRRYESYGFRTNFPIIPGDKSPRFGLDLSGNYSSRPQDNFFGMGNDTDFSDMTRFRSVSRNVAAGINSQVNKAWGWRAQVGYENVGITRPRGFLIGVRDFRSAQEEFADQQVPGLDTGAEIVSATVSLERNTTDVKHTASRGSLHHFEVSVNESRGKGDFSYWKYRYELRQYFPLSSDRRKVIALRADVETNQEKGGSQIPFFDLPSVGGQSTVRGFESLRFTDKSAVSMGLEYRYRIWRWFDWGLFVDEGQVAPEIGDFGWDRFHTGYGMRFIVRPKQGRAMSIDVGRSHESWKVYLVLNPKF